MRRAPLVTLIAALALVLTGCSDEDEPSGLPSDAATPPATTSAPTSAAPLTPPTAPATVNEQTDEGAKAAAMFFIEALEYFYNTGDPTVLQSASASECQSCGEVITSISGLYASGGHMTTDQYVVSGVTLETDYGQDAKAYRLHGVQPKREQYDASGNVIDADEEMPLTVTVGLEWQSGHWLVAEFKV